MRERASFLPSEPNRSAAVSSTTIAIDKTHSPNVLFARKISNPINAKPSVIA